MNSGENMANPSSNLNLNPDLNMSDPQALESEVVSTPSGAPRVEPRRSGRRLGSITGANPTSNLASETSAAPEDEPSQGHSPFMPLLLGGMALLGTLAFQSYQMLNDRQALQTAHVNQQPTVDNAGKLRGSLDTLAADTQRLADAGNASARLLVEELKKRGVTINPSAASAAAR